MKKILSIIFLCFLVIPGIFAITGEIGNARAIITREWNGEEILERTIFVRNPNDVKIDIRLEPSEELADIVELIDANFSLPPGEEKAARYLLMITKEGHWDGRINIFFRPEEGNSVVLSSTLIINVGDVEEPDEIPEEVSDNETSDEPTDDTLIEENDEEDDDTDNSTVGFGIKGSRVTDDDSSAWPIVIVIIIVVIILAAIIGSYFLLKK